MNPGASGGSSSSQSLVSVKAQTTAGIVSKTTSTVMQKRVAHTPTMKVSTCLLMDISYHYSLVVKVNLAIFWPLQSSSLKRPIIPTEFGAKIPTNIRQRYLNTFIDECVKFCPSEDVAFQTVRNPACREACVELSSVTLFLCFRPLMRRSWCMSAVAAKTSTST